MMDLLMKARALADALTERRAQLVDAIGVDFYDAHVRDNSCDTSFPAYLKLGNLVNNTYTFPCLIETKHVNGIAFCLNETNREEVNLTMEHMAIQVIEQMRDDYCEITIIDPVHLGANFKHLRRLNDRVLVEKVFGDEAIQDCVRRNYHDSVRIINECLTHYTDLEDYNHNSGGKQKLRVILIADFPHSFQLIMKELITILTNAKDAGVLFLLSVNEDFENEYIKEECGRFLDLVVRLREFNEEEDLYKIENYTEEYKFNSEFTIKINRKDINPDHLVKRVIAINKRHASNERHGSSEGGVRIPIGKCEGVTFYFTFGHDSENYSALIGGQSGKGKTVLLNNIIAKGIECYGKDELMYAIIDCSGVGFQQFKHSKRLSFFESSSSPIECFRVIKDLDELLKDREGLFKASEVDNIDKYNDKNESKMPRLVVVVDEFHVLFADCQIDGRYDENDNYIAPIDIPEVVEEILISRIVRIGRKFGVHLILSTQSLDGGIPSNVLNNIPLRIALGMTRDQSLSFFEFANTAAENLDRGIAIYNTRNGDPKHNRRVQVNYIKDEEIQRIHNLQDSLL